MALRELAVTCHTVDAGGIDLDVSRLEEIERLFSDNA